MFKDYPDMLTPREAMEALGIGKTTMYGLLFFPFAIIQILLFVFTDILSAICSF